MMTGQLVSAIYESGEEPMWRVFSRWGAPTKEPQAMQWLNSITAEERSRLMAEIKAERQTIRPLTDEEIEDIKARQIEAEEREATLAAERRQLAAEIREQYGDTLLARKAAAQFGVDLDAND